MACSCYLHTVSPQLLNDFVMLSEAMVVLSRGNIIADIKTVLYK